MKVKAGIERVGVATNYRNPDDSLHHAVNTSVKLYIIYRSTRGSRFKRARSRGVRFSRATAAAGQKVAAKPHRLNVVTSYVSRVETISPFI
jgi:hypothetical protein